MLGEHGDVMGVVTEADLIRRLAGEVEKWRAVVQAAGVSIE